MQNDYYMKKEKLLLTILIFLFFSANAFATFCSCVQNHTVWYGCPDGICSSQITIEWHYMTAGSCSDTAYTFGSADVYVDGMYIGYQYWSSGFSNPCYFYS